MAGPTSWVRVLLVSIVLFSAGLDFFFFTGFYASDDIKYFLSADGILQNGRLPEHVEFGADRLSIVGWNVLAMLVVGRNVQAVAATYVLLHQALNLLTFLLARRLFNWKVGLLAAYGVATLPMMILYSTCILPDTMMACFFVLSLYAFLRGLEARRGPRAWPAYGWLVLSGLCVGFGYMAKETALILLPFYFVLWLVRELQEKKRAAIARGAVFALGFFGILAAETVTLTYLTRQPHVRLGWATEDASQITRTRVARYGASPLERLESVGRRLSSQHVPVGFKGLMIGAVLLFPIVCRRWWSLLFLALWTFAYLTWGSMRFTEYLPPSIQTRYYIPVVPFAMIVCAAVLVRLVEWLMWLMRPVGLERVVRVAAVATAGAYPLLGLGGPNRLAGKLYNAQMVAGTNAAVQRAVMQDQQPIAVSTEPSWRVVNPMLAGWSHERIFTFPRLAQHGLIMELLAAGGWHYVDIPLKYVPDEAAPRELERCMRALIHSEAQTITNSAELAEADFVWSLDPAIPHSVEMQGYRLFLRRIERFQPPRRRTAEFAMRLFKTGAHWRFTPRRSAKSVLLLETVARPRDALQFAGAASRQEYELRPEQWQVWGAPDGKLTATETGGLRLTWAGTIDGHAWLLPRGKTAVKDIRAQPRTLSRFAVEVEAIDEVTAELVVDVAPVESDGFPAYRARVRIESGKSALSIFPSTAARQYTPMFLVMGSGEFVLKRLVLETITPVQFKDLTALIADWEITDHREACNVGHNARGGPEVTLDLGADEHASFGPRDGADLPAFQLSAHKRFDVALRVKITAGAKAYARLLVYENAEADKAILRKYLRVHPGLNQFSLRTGDSPASIRPEFKLSGDGRFSIDEFTLTACE